MTRTRLPAAGPELSDAIGRALFRADPTDSEYGRCVQVSQLLHNVARDIEPRDPARAELVREYAHAVSAGGNALPQPAQEVARI